MLEFLDYGCVTVLYKECLSESANHIISCLVCVCADNHYDSICHLRLMMALSSTCA